MSWLQIIHSDSERQGVRALLEAMRQIPVVTEALRLLDEGRHIASIGVQLQTEFLKEQLRCESLNNDLDFYRSSAVSLQSTLEAFHAHPMEQRSREAEQALLVAEQQLHETQRELSAALERHEHELAANAQELQALRTENVELKRLAAKQHGQLSDLLGSEPPK